MTLADLQLRAARAALAAAFHLVEEAPSIAGQVVISPAVALGWNLKHMGAISDALKAEGLEPIAGPLSRALADTSFAPSPDVPAPKGQMSDLPHASRGGADVSGGGQ